MRWLFASALALACASIGTQADEVERRLAELGPREVQACIGAPQERDLTEDSETWFLGRSLDMHSARGYRLRVEDHSDETLLERSHAERDVALFMGAPRDSKIPKNHCRLMFHFVGHRTVAFEARGRDHRGLRAHAACTLLLRHCVSRLGS